MLLAFLFLAFVSVAIVFLVILVCIFMIHVVALAIVYMRCSTRTFVYAVAVNIVWVAACIHTQDLLIYGHIVRALEVK